MPFSNTPPVMYLERNWKIVENEKTDSVIARVQAHDNENDILTFGLEANDFGNSQREFRALPFRIDQNTGVVYLNDSLAGRGGEKFFLYVTVSDGMLTAKNEVYVNIQNENSTKYTDVYSPHLPSFTPHASNITRLLPPFKLLPGVQEQRPTSNILPSNSNIYTTFQTNTYLTNDTENSGNKNHYTDEENENNKNDKTSTVLKAVGNNNNNNQQDGNNNNNNRPPTVNLKEDSAVKANLPIILSICGIIFLAAALIAMYMFRKHLCAFGKSLKKKSKEEMAKKSNQSNISSISITEDSRNSMVLQHWNGPMAFSNRYAPPWERNLDSQHLQV